MKLKKISVIAALVLGGLVASSTMVRAADADNAGKGKGKGGKGTIYVNGTKAAEKAHRVIQLEKGVLVH